MILLTSLACAAFSNLNDRNTLCAADPIHARNTAARFLPLALSRIQIVIRSLNEYNVIQQLSRYTARDRLLATQCPSDNCDKLVRLSYMLLDTSAVGHAYVNVNRPINHVTCTACFRIQQLRTAVLIISVLIISSNFFFVNIEAGHLSFCCMYAKHRIVS